MLAYSKRPVKIKQFSVCQVHNRGLKKTDEVPVTGTKHSGCSFRHIGVFCAAANAFDVLKEKVFSPLQPCQRSKSSLPLPPPSLHLSNRFSTHVHTLPQRHRYPRLSVSCIRHGSRGLCRVDGPTLHEKTKAGKRHCEKTAWRLLQW